MAELRLTLDLRLPPDPAVIAPVWAAAGIQHSTPEVCRMLLLAQLAAPLDETGWQGAALIVGAALEAVAPERDTEAAEPEVGAAESVAFAQMAAAFDRKEGVGNVSFLPLDERQIVQGADGRLYASLTQTAGHRDFVEPPVALDDDPIVPDLHIRLRRVMMGLPPEPDASADPGPILIEEDDQPDTELSPSQETTEGVATREGNEQPEASAPQEAAATGVASPRCSGSEGADDRLQQSLQAKSDLPPAVEVSETAEGGGIVPAPEPMAEAPDWSALIDRVEAGESIGSVAKAAGVNGRALGCKVTARRRLLKPAGPEAAAIPPVEAAAPAEPPAQAAPEEEAADVGSSLPPATENLFWTPQRDLALVQAMIGGRGSYAASQQLGCKPPDCVNRFKQLLPHPGTVAQQQLLKRLRAQVEAETGHGA